MKLLLVEDDKMIVKGLTYLLEKEGYSLTAAGTVKEAAEQLGTADMLILDVTLPDGNGFDFYSSTVKEKAIPTLFLTARDDEEDVVRGLTSGAADYMTKPFYNSELLLRLKKITAEIREKNIASAGNVVFDFDSKNVTENGKQVDLTAVEIGLLEVLFKNRGKVMTKEILGDHVYDITGNSVTDNAITVYINRMRKKFKEDFIVTKKGIGYRIDD